MLAFDMNEKQPKWFDRQRFAEKSQQSPDEGSKEKLFDLQNLDLEKN
jgi:hypothetical protein